MDEVIRENLASAHPLALGLPTSSSPDLANGNASAHTIRAYRGDLLQFAGQARQQLEHHEQLSAATGELAGVCAELSRTRTALRATVADRSALQTQTEVLACGVEDGRRRNEALHAELADARPALPRAARRPGHGPRHRSQGRPGRR